MWNYLAYRKSESLCQKSFKRLKLLVSPYGAHKLEWQLLVSLSSQVLCNSSLLVPVVSYEEESVMNIAPGVDPIPLLD